MHSQNNDSSLQRVQSPSFLQTGSLLSQVFAKDAEPKQELIGLGHDSPFDALGMFQHQRTFECKVD